MGDFVCIFVWWGFFSFCLLFVFPPLCFLRVFFSFFLFLKFSSGPPIYLSLENSFQLPFTTQRNAAVSVVTAAAAL